MLQYTILWEVTSMNEQYYEKLLNIKTSGEQKKFNDSLHYNRYEPTSYLVLETLFNNYEVKSTDYIIDFGCGKGRLNFYANYFYGCTVTGIEMNNFFYNEALHNKHTFLSKHNKLKDKINFVNCFAEEYEVQPDDNKFYFFNPFSVQIFIKVIGNILESLNEYYRPVDLILYYPSEDYIYYLDTFTFFSLKNEIKLPDLYKNNTNERILIYRLNFNN